MMVKTDDRVIQDQKLCPLGLIRSDGSRVGAGLTLALQNWSDMA